MQHSVVHSRAPKNLEYYQVVYDCREHGFYSISTIWAFGKRKRNTICIASVNNVPVNLEIEFNAHPNAPQEATLDNADAAVVTAAIEWLMGKV